MKKYIWYNNLIPHQETAKWAWHSVRETCMTAPEKYDKTKAAGDITQPQLLHLAFQINFSCSFCWKDFNLYMQIMWLKKTCSTAGNNYYVLVWKNSWTVTSFKEGCLRSLLFVARKIWNPGTLMKMGRVRLGLMALLFDRCALSLFLLTPHNPTDGHDSFCHPSPTQRLSLPFYPVNWLALNLSVKMGIALRLSSQNGFEIR